MTEEPNDLRAAWAKAFAAAQGEFKAIPKSKTAHVRTEKANYSYSYADLADIAEAIRPALAKHGLSVQQDVRTEYQRIDRDVVGSVEVTTVVTHEGGYSQRFGPIRMPAGGTPQALGSSITYARRYALCAALGIAAEADDDAQIAEGEERATRPPRATQRSTERRRAAAKKDDAKPEAGASTATWTEAVQLFGSKGDVVTWVRDEFKLSGSVDPKKITEGQIRKVMELKREADGG